MSYTVLDRDDDGNITEWECDNCGLVHRHAPEGVKLGNHNLRERLDDEIVRGMSGFSLDYEGACHCGWHDLNAKTKRGEVDVLPEERTFVAEFAERKPIPGDIEKDIYEGVDQSGVPGL